MAFWRVERQMRQWPRSCARSNLLGFDVEIYPYIMDGFSTSVEHNFVNFDAFKMVVAVVVVPCSGAHPRDAGPHLT